MKTKSWASTKNRYVFSFALANFRDSKHSEESFDPLKKQDFDEEVFRFLHERNGVDSAFPDQGERNETC